MARGWESKAVEDQQAEAQRRTIAAPVLSPEAQDRQRRVHTLTLGLADLTAQLQAACRPVHRDMLRQRIAAVEALLAELRAEGDSGTGAA
jgi:hypothetical protein